MDSTGVCGHPHASGGREKGFEAEEAFGRSRGRFGTNVHLACADEHTAVAVERAAEAGPGRVAAQAGPEAAGAGIPR